MLCDGGCFSRHGPRARRLGNLFLGDSRLPRSVSHDALRFGNVPLFTRLLETPQCASRSQQRQRSKSDRNHQPLPQLACRRRLLNGPLLGLVARRLG